MKLFLKTTFLLLLLTACKKEVTSITSQDPLTNLTIEDATITSFFKTHNESETTKNSVLLFYKNRNNAYAWFSQDGMTEAVMNFQNQLQNYSIDFEDNSFETSELDALIDSKKETENNAVKRQKLELLLTTTYFNFAKKAYGGVTKTANELDWYIPRKKENYQVMLDSLIASDKNKVPKNVNLYYTKLLQKLHSYRNIQKNGGFPKINSNQEFLLKTEANSTLLQVKKRLVLSGDLKTNDNTILYTLELVKAISNFQQRVGMPTNGKLDVKTIAALNITIEDRIKQILINLERLRWIPGTIEDDYLIVNIPEYKLHVIENNKLLWETNVVVGKEAKRTSIFRGNIARIILNPYWNIPNSIINEEILPKLQQNKNYLESNNMEVLSGDKVIDATKIDWSKYTKNIPFLIRQKPGLENALGKMKFLFPNNFNIYLHDTPAKELFNQGRRDFSHGCIRVENPKKLALYLLDKNRGWNADKVDQVLKTTQETGIAIKPKLPVYIVYFTAWVDSNNQLNFRNDIYNLDEQLGKVLFEGK